jgi:hypothetical protein
LSQAEQVNQRGELTLDKGQRVWAPLAIYDSRWLKLERVRTSISKAGAIRKEPHQTTHRTSRNSISHLCKHMYIYLLSTHVPNCFLPQDVVRKTHRRLHLHGPSIDTALRFQRAKTATTQHPSGQHLAQMEEAGAVELRQQRELAAVASRG